ncbi:hypothetical protein RRG08_018454 [Elysia crispata]|uniref:Uncharacterized protein n=1 Tax=Elysia crispata TaxID=231223 RepID=A0AAE0YTM7_9GAST|nr:hypothetical protein RRG08_018454 [Elysia crispata]
MAESYDSINRELPTSLPPEGEEGDEKESLIYTVEQTPPWHLSLILGLQQSLITFQSVFAYPLVVKSAMCIDGDDVGLVQLISVTSMMVGLSTFLQSTIGVRLPIIQCISAAYITPTIVLLETKDSSCPYNHPEFSNTTLLPERGSQGHKDIWHRNIREVQGSLMVASLLCLVIGLSGIIGSLLKYIGPLTVAIILILTSISLLDITTKMASSQWYICFMTIFLVVLFSQYLRDVSIALPGFKEKFKIFLLFSILIALFAAWIICLILTKAGVFPDNPEKWGYRARTDSRTEILKEAHWVYFIYPGYFGMPTVSLAGVISYMAVFLSCGVEAVGTYYPTAPVCGAPPPPASAISRGIFIEGVCGLLSGAWGSPGGTVAYSQNIANIWITKVGSRVVTQVAGVLLILMGCVGKFGALFSTIPDPVIGGILFPLFGMIGAVGVANLQHVNMNSARNLFVIGLSLLFGLGLPQWVRENRGSIHTGNSELDNVIVVVGGTSIIVGGFMALILDNTIPGTPEDRGLTSWGKEKECDGRGNISVYDMPYIQPWLDRCSFLRYIPICPRSSLDTKDSNNENSAIMGQNGFLESAEEGSSRLN